MPERPAGTPRVLLVPRWHKRQKYEDRYAYPKAHELSFVYHQLVADAGKGRVYRPLCTIEPGLYLVTACFYGSLSCQLYVLTLTASAVMSSALPVRPAASKTAMATSEK